MMGKSGFLWSVSVVAIAVALLCGLVIYQVSHFNETKIIFLDVGQGDAILITEGMNQILIDGGPNGTRLLEQVGQYIPFWDRNIELVIATHPDNDHINGLVDIFKVYNVHEFWHSGAQKDTAVYAALLRYVERSDVQVRSVFAGMDSITPRGGVLSVVYPYIQEEAEAYQHDANEASVTTTFAVGGEVFFFGGDLPSEKEDQLRLNQDVTILKAGHHGSRTSTSSSFLQKTTPTHVIFSVGKDNSYGHPHDDVIKRILASGASIFRTDREGSIVYTCTEVCALSFD